MVIKDLQFKIIKIELPEKFKVAFGELNHSENVLVKVETDSPSITGYGEAAPIAFVTGETAQGVVEILKLLRPGLIGLNPLAIDHVHARMDAAIYANTSAKCAVDLALYDIMGKALEKPVYQLLGGACGVVENDVTIGIGNPNEMAEKALHYVNDLGYGVLKIKGGVNVQNDIQAVSLIRDAVGTSIRLRVDANQGYTVSEAERALEGFKRYGVEAVEQCLPYWDMEGAAYLRAKMRGIQLMLDESIHGPHDAARACKLQAADILNIKLMKSGGLYPAQQINAIAQASGVRCMVGCMIETRLALTAGLSLVAAKCNVTEADCDSFMYYDAGQTGVTGGFEVERGQLLLSDAPGFGVDVAF